MGGNPSGAQFDGVPLHANTMQLRVYMVYGPKHIKGTLYLHGSVPVFRGYVVIGMQTERSCSRT